MNSDFDRSIAFLWAKKVPLLALLCIGAAIGAGLSYCFKPLYRADAILVPSDEMLGLNVTGALGSLGGLGGLASLVGIGGAGNKESEAIETLKSRGLTTSYIEAHNLLPIIFHDRWDSAGNKWKSSAFGHTPTLEDGYRSFDRRIRTIVENRKTGLTTISITWEDPRLAKEWTEGLVNAANEQLRVQALERSTRNLEYLRKASDATPIMEVKATVYKLMETEIKKQMVAYGGKDYAFRVVDAPIVSERKIFPVRSLFLVTGAIVLPLLWLSLLWVKRLLIRISSQAE
jgi:hypothetical protein